MNTLQDDGRRGFLRATGMIGAGLILPTFAACSKNPSPAREEQEKGTEVGPAEDLMREHGVLNRILLIYEESLHRLTTSPSDLKPESLAAAADIVRRFIEEYHEKLEEDYIFPRFEKAGRLVDLVTVLRRQHDASRELTDRVLNLATAPALGNSDDRMHLGDALRGFIRVYRPHEAREDTVLFPAFHGIVSPHEYDALGEEFEKKEHKLFGEDGFDRMVEKVASIERELGIYDLAQFTPTP